MSLPPALVPAPEGASAPLQERRRPLLARPGPTSRRKLEPRPAPRGTRLLNRVMDIAYAGAWPARLYGLFPAATKVRLVAHDVPTGRRAPGRPPLRIAFLSDLHLGPTTHPATLDRAFALADEVRPDLLVLGGDYVATRATPRILEELADRVAGVRAAAKLAVLGNHDYWADPRALAEALEAGGARVLSNEGLRLGGPHGDVGVLGLDDPTTGRPEAEAALRATEGAAVRVAVCHSPDGVPEIIGTSVATLLCGHTHGGHIALPGEKPLWIPGRFGMLWPHGRHHVQGHALIVSRGVGGSALPFRVNAPPDVLLVTVS